MFKQIFFQTKHSKNNATLRWSKDQHSWAAPRKWICFKNQRNEFTWSKTSKYYSKDILIHRLRWNNSKNTPVSLIIWAQHRWASQKIRDWCNHLSVAVHFFSCVSCIQGCQGCSLISWPWPTAKNFYPLPFWPKRGEARGQKKIGANSEKKSCWALWRT